MYNFNIKARLLETYSSYPYATQQKAFFLFIIAIAVIPYVVFMSSYQILKVIKQWNATEFQIYFLYAPINALALLCCLAIINYLLKGKYAQVQFVVGFTTLLGAVPFLFSSTLTLIGIIETSDAREVLILKFFFIIISSILPLACSLVFGLKKTFIAIFVVIETCFLFV